MKTLFAGLSLAAMMAVAPAMAQTATDTPTPAQPSAGSTTNSNSSMTSGGALSASNTAMAADQVRVSRLINSTVRNAANESVGDVNDLLLDKTGKVTAVIVGVGGFLGIGERNVAMSFDQLQVRNENGTVVATANVTKDQLKNVPEWRDPNSSASRSGSTTSSGTSGTTGTGSSSTTSK
jgi:high-affinity K+ transport system ATPase subunit B